MISPFVEMYHFTKLVCVNFDRHYCLPLKMFVAGEINYSIFYISGMRQSNPFSQGGGAQGHGHPGLSYRIQNFLLWNRNLYTLKNMSHDDTVSFKSATVSLQIGLQIS
jgi:hypothetical protein